MTAPELDDDMTPPVPTDYTVTVSHPTGSFSGKHRLTVKPNFDGWTRYVTGTGFGCSRDYNTACDKTAIRMLLAEHGATAVRITKARVS